MANKQILIENNLLDVYNKFMHLCNETTYFSGNLDEEGEDDENAPQGGQEAPTGGNQAPQDAPMDGSGLPDEQVGGMPQDGAVPQGDMGGQSNMAVPPMGDQGGMDGGMPQDPPMDDMDALEDEEDGEEDDVIDVDDITDAQEKTNSKVNKVGRNLGKVDDKIVSLMKVIKNLQQMIDNNNAEIEAFKTEFERRNPTPTEKLNLRSLDSYPFNANPKDYWKGKAEQPEVSGKRYDAYADNQEPVAEKEYVISQDDVNDYTDNSIQNSFHLSDDLRSTIEKIFDL